MEYDSETIRRHLEEIDKVQNFSRKTKFSYRPFFVLPTQYVVVVSGKN